MAVVVDASRWPLVVGTISTGTSIEEWRAYFAHMEELQLARRQRFFYITDFRPLTQIPSASERRVLAELIAAAEPVTERYLLAAALVIPNPMIRGALTALNWLRRPVRPQYFVASIEEAYGVAIDTLRREGIAITPEIQALGGGPACIEPRTQGATS